MPQNAFTRRTSCRNLSQLAPRRHRPCLEHRPQFDWSPAQTAGEHVMGDILPVIAFAALIAAQFLAVIYCVRHHHRQSQQELEERKTQKQGARSWEYTADL